MRLSRSSITLLLAATFHRANAQPASATPAPAPADAAPKPPSPPYLSPDESAKLVQLPPGYRLELVLSEPDIREPVVSVFDGNGRLYVAEMRTYMQDADAKDEKAATSRVSLHWSSKGDGHLDRHSVFVDNLLLPRMILPPKDSVLIQETDTDDVYAYRDTDHDGVADDKKLFYAFERRAANFEHQPSGLIWAQDNWLYTTFNAERIRWTPKGVIKEPTGPNGGQWGLAQDNYGKPWFVNAPGELGPVNFQQPIGYGAFRNRDESAAERDRTHKANAGIWAHQLRHERKGHAAVGSMSWGDADRIQAVPRPCFETQVAPTSCRHEARTPIPTELTLLLANHGATTNGVIDFARDVRQAVRTNIAHRALEPNGEFVATQSKQRFDRPAMPEEHAFRARHFAAVEGNARNRVQAVGDKFYHFLFEHLGVDRKFGAIFPVALLDSLQFTFIRAPKRISDLLIAKQVRVDTAGHHGRQPGFLFCVAKVPSPRRPGKVIHERGRGKNSFCCRREKETVAARRVRGT